VLGKRSFRRYLKTAWRRGRSASWSLCPWGYVLILSSLAENKQFDRVPSHILELETKLRDEYTVKHAAHVSMVRQHRLEEFSKLGSPSKEAEFDVGLFLSKYFLDARGAPDRSKTREPLSLPGYIYRHTLHAAAERINGLHTYCGGEGDSRILVIGWNRTAVWAKAGEVDRQHREGKQTQREAQWERKIQSHRDYVAGLAQRKGRFKPENAVGTYVVSCKEISEEWDNADDLTMSITESTGPAELVAEFDFGILEGIMRLGRDPEPLALSGSDDEEADDEELDEESEPAPTGTKRGRTAKAPKRATARKSKRNKSASDAAHPRRLYLQWRGRETGESEIQLDYGNTHTGHLDFTDAGCTVFEGVANLVYVYKAKFRGFKINDEPARKTRSWGDYSEEEHEYARTARWR
jgi:hypothetical protein